MKERKNGWAVIYGFECRQLHFLIFIVLFYLKCIPTEPGLLFCYFRPSCAKFSTTTPTFLHVFGRAPGGLQFKKSCAVIEIFNLQIYSDLETRVRGH